MKAVLKNDIGGIVQSDHPVLRMEAAIVLPKDIPSPKIQKVIDRMKSALTTQEDGVAIAAPQIGESLAIFVVSKRIGLLKKDPSEITPEEKVKAVDTVYVNPVIIKTSKTKKEVEEGCLSVRYLYGKLKRADKVTVTAYDEKGKKFTRGGSGLLAQIFQHEIDHLHGILFTDSAYDIQDLPPEKEDDK